MHKLGGVGVRALKAMRVKSLAGKLGLESAHHMRRLVRLIEQQQHKCVGDLQGKTRPVRLGVCSENATTEGDAVVYITQFSVQENQTSLHQASDERMERSLLAQRMLTAQKDGAVLSNVKDEFSKLLPSWRSKLQDVGTSRAELISRWRQDNGWLAY